MPGTFPTDPAPASCTLESNQPTVVDYSESGKSQSRKIGGHLWKAKLSWSRLPRETLNAIFGFMQYQEGRLGTFKILLPNFATHTGDGTGTITASGAVTAGNFVANTTGWSGTTGPRSGDIFKFDGHDKVYQMIYDSAITAGSCTLIFWPELIADVALDEGVTVNGVEFSMSPDDDIITWKGSAPNMATISINMTESL